MRTKPASLIGDSNVAKAPQVKKAAPSSPQGPLRWYRVLGGPAGPTAGQIGPFRREHGDFFLKIGKEINSTEYNITEIQNAGVELKEIETPGWYARVQEQAQEKAEELREAGIEVGDAPEFVPTPLKTQPKTEVPSA